MRTAAKWGVLALSVAMWCGGFVAGPLQPASASVDRSGARPGPARFVSVPPSRILDTRTSGRALAAGGQVKVLAAGAFGVGVNATSLVVNITATETQGPGFVTAWNGETVRPLASNLGVEHAGHTVSNLATVPVGLDGSFTVYVSVGSHIVLDVFGFYEPAQSGASGRLTTLAPGRVFDSRTDGGRRTPGSTTRIGLSPAIPLSASAAVLNITIDDASAPGFWTAFPAGSARPGTANVNVQETHQTLANQAIVPVTGGAVEIYSQTGGHLIVDVVGWYSGVTDPVSNVGLYVAVAPTRVLDTREVGLLNPIEDQLKPRAGWTIEVDYELRLVVPATAQAVALNATVAYPDLPGYVTVWAAGTQRPTASSLNAFRRGQVVANHVISPLGTRGFSMYTQQQAHLIVDVAGYFTGTPVSSSLAAPNNQVIEKLTHLSIPAMGIDRDLRIGLEDATLDRGPMRWLFSSEAGELGTMRILGHRASHGAPFLGLGNLAAGDRITLTNATGRHVYVVTGSRVVLPNEVMGLADAATANLQLVACHPIGSAEQRLVVRAELVE